MVSWNIIRSATDEDERRLNAAGERFVRAHADELARLLWEGPDLIASLRGVEACNVIEVALGAVGVGEDLRTMAARQRVQRLWRAATQRALRSRVAEGIHLGTVGYSVT